MHSKLRAALAAALLGAAPALAATAPGPDEESPTTAEAAAPGRTDPLLAELVAEALSRNPDLEALRQSVEAARRQPAQARSLADPVLSLSYTNDGWAPSLGSMPMATLTLMASQDLPWPGKRDLRGRIAATGADTAEQQLARGRLGVAAEVRRAYFGLLQARALLALAEEQGTLWEQIESVTRARYAVGQGSQQDVLRTQLERTRVGRLLAEQRLEEEVRLAELDRLLARSPATPLETRAELTLGAALEAPDAALARLRALSPELAASRIALERGRLQVDLARKASRPEFAVQGGYMNRGGLGPMWQAGVSVSLPVRRERRAAAVADAEAELRAAEARLEATDLQLVRRTRERLIQIETARRVADLYTGGIVPQARLSVEAALAGYEAGRIPFVSVLEALTTLSADRAALVRVLADARRAEASLEEASLEATSDVTAAAPGMGGAPAPGSMAPGREPASGMTAMGNR